MNSSRKASLFFMDYPSQKRLKIWAESEVIDAEQNVELLQNLKMPGYEAPIERLIIFRIQAYDWNCPQHITPRYTSEEIAEGVAKSNPDILKSCCPDDVE